VLTDFSMVKVQGRDELDEICVPHPSREDVYNKIRMQRVGVRLGEGAKVVLSACNSGRGKIKAECMVGLARGFLLGRVAWCRRPRLAMLRLARRPAIDQPVSEKGVADGLQEAWKRLMHWAGFLVMGASMRLPRGDAFLQRL